MGFMLLRRSVVGKWTGGAVGAGKETVTGDRLKLQRIFSRYSDIMVFSRLAIQPRPAHLTQSAPIAAALARDHTARARLRRTAKLGFQRYGGGARPAGRPPHGLAGTRPIIAAQPLRPAGTPNIRITC